MSVAEAEKRELWKIILFLTEELGELLVGRQKQQQGSPVPSPLRLCFWRWEDGTFAHIVFSI